MMEIIFWFSSIIAAWYTSRYFYMMNKKDSEEIISRYKEANTILINEVKKLNSGDKIALKETRITKAADDYLIKGTPKYMIDTFTDLSKEEKAEMYDLVLLRAKGRTGGNNPYK